MSFTFIHDDDGLAALQGPWNELLRRSITDVPFLRHEYLSVWWSTLGGGEWPSGELWVGVRRDPLGRVNGVAPLFFTRTRQGRPGLMFLGSIEISDYLDLIAAADDVAALAEDLLAGLAEEGPPGWEVIDLYNLPESSSTLAALTEAAARRGWTATQERLQPCPVVRLPATFEEYLDGLDRKQRHELRRKIRRLEAHPDPVTWRIVGTNEDLTAAVEAFMSLMAIDPEKRRFLTPAMRTQFQRSARVGQENGWLQLALMDVAGVPVAGYLCLDYGNRIWVYNSGLNPEYQWLSPGWVLLAHLIEWAIEHGRQEFDFLRGNEDYKYRLGGVAHWVCRLTITRR
ncbi:MAG: GNAT family N-acetyltransferase [Chloroflexota bacterium]